VADALTVKGLVTAERLTARITGRVQGVGFRWWVQRRAEALGLVGWVMNALDERSVELVAEGTPEALAVLERFVRVGPSGASVESVEIERGPASGEFDRFGIVRP
jgi:acylphosphatase